MPTIKNHDTLDYSTSQSSYDINGGILNVNIASLGGLGGSGSTTTINPGSSGGEIDFTTGSLTGTLVSTSSYTFNFSSTPPSNFVLDFKNSSILSATNTYIVVATYNKSLNKTTITATSATKAPLIGTVVGQQTIIVNIPGNPYGYSSGNTTLSTGKAYITPCYLPGTLIETPKGRVLVEDLQQGDEVYAYKNDVRSTETIRWVGHSTVHTENLDEKSVRIKAHAIAENVPFKDLLVTPEHCLFFNGAFVPARLLVNGRSIVIDQADTFEIYHVETNEHAVIMADGVLAESYLDTGNRSTFKAKGHVVIGAFNDVAKTWEHDAAAPLTTSRDFIEPIHAELSARAETLGFALENAAPEFTDDAALALVTASGATLPLLRRTGQHAVFQIPAGIDRVYLTSRTVSPRDLIGPFVDDRRELGVMVSDITLFDGPETQKVTSHLTQEDAHGWEHRDEEGRRWTKGCAEINLGQRRSDTLGVLSIEIIAGGPYRVDSTNETLAQLAQHAAA